MTAKSILSTLQSNPAARLKRHVYARTWRLSPCASDASNLAGNVCDGMVIRGEIEKVGKQGNEEIYRVKLTGNVP